MVVRLIYGGGHKRLCPSLIQFLECDEMVNTIQAFINAWSYDIAFGWSIMDVAGLLIILLLVSAVINYFFFKAGG